LVVVLSLWALLSTLPELMLPWQPDGWTGISADPDGVITDVAKGSSGEAAGIVPGDRIDLAHATFDGRRFFFSFAPPGSRVTVPIVHDGLTRQVTLTSLVRARTPADNITDEIEVLSALVTIVVSAALVLVRPGAMTFGFFLFELSALWVSEWFLVRAPTPLYIAENFWWRVIAGPGLAGLLRFCARFPGDVSTGWRVWVDRYAWVAIPLLSVPGAWTAYADIFGLGAPRLDRILPDAAFAAIAFSLAVFLDAFRTATGQDRQRMRWVFASLVLVLVIAVGNWLIIGFSALPLAYIALYNVSLSVPTIVPLTVAYVLVKQRVVDVSFVLSRAVVYGVVTAIIIICFAALDWVFGRMLAATQWAVPAELLVAIGLGFGLNTMEKRVDRVVDGVLFRKRHIAEIQLARAAQTLPHAPTYEAADEHLLRVPVGALELTSGAIFRRDEEGRLTRVASIGWSDRDLASLEPADSLVLQLVASQAPMRMREALLPRADLPSKEAAPVIAMPVITRHNLRAIAFYGPHRSGADLDDDEIRELTEVTKAAAAAYDHIEAEALRKQVRDLSDVIARGLPAH